MTSEIHVVYTTAVGTCAALEAARQLSKDLGICVRVLAFHIVPYPLLIDEPPVSPEFEINRIMDELKASFDHTKFSFHHVLCRDVDDALRSALKENSLVLIGGRRRLFKSREERMTQKLRRLGHDVLFVGIGEDDRAMTSLSVHGAQQPQ
jgi:hypothetical protein